MLWKQLDAKPAASKVPPTTIRARFMHIIVHELIVCRKSDIIKRKR